MPKQKSEHKRVSSNLVGLTIICVIVIGVGVWELLKESRLGLMDTPPSVKLAATDALSTL